MGSGHGLGAYAQRWCMPMDMLCAYGFSLRFRGVDLGDGACKAFRDGLKLELLRKGTSTATASAAQADNAQADSQPCSQGALQYLAWIMCLIHPGIHVDVLQPHTSPTARFVGGIPAASEPAVSLGRSALRGRLGPPLCRWQRLHCACAAPEEACSTMALVSVRGLPSLQQLQRHWSGSRNSCREHCCQAIAATACMVFCS